MSFCYNFTILNSLENQQNFLGYETSTRDGQQEDVIHIMTVICGSHRWEEALIMMKSVIYFTECPLHFHIFTDGNGTFLSQHLHHWLTQTSGFEFHFHNVADLYKDQFNHLGASLEKNKPCSTARLFVHSYLLLLEWVLYMDIDTVALTSVKGLWDTKDHMIENQVIAATYADVQPNPSGYFYNKSVPFVEPTGMCAGIIIMNLKRLRASNWTQMVTEVYEKYQKLLKWGDQDIMNIIFNFNEKPQLVNFNVLFKNLRYLLCPNTLLYSNCFSLLM